MSVGISPDRALVYAAIEQVWGSMLFTAADSWSDGLPAEFGTGLRAQIELRGDWDGRLVLTCETEVAHQIAAAMLGTGPGEALPQADVRDALGEVLNVVGGSVKGALGGAMTLGLPVVHHAWAPPPAAECFVVSWRGAPVYVQIVPDAA